MDSKTISRAVIEHYLEEGKELKFIFTLPRCESCVILKAELERRKIEIPYLSLREHGDLANDFDINTAPTMIWIKDGGYKFYTGYETIAEKLIKKTDDADLVSYDEIENVDIPE